MDSKTSSEPSPKTATLSSRHTSHKQNVGRRTRRRSKTKLSLDDTASPPLPERPNRRQHTKRQKKIKKESAAAQVKVLLDPLRKDTILKSKEMYVQGTIQRAEFLKILTGSFTNIAIDVAEDYTNSCRVNGSESESGSGSGTVSGKKKKTTTTQKTAAAPAFDPPTKEEFEKLQADQKGNFSGLKTMCCLSISGGPFQKWNYWEEKKLFDEHKFQRAITQARDTLQSIEQYGIPLLALENILSTVDGMQQLEACDDVEKLLSLLNSSLPDEIKFGFSYKPNPDAPPGSPLGFVTGGCIANKVGKRHDPHYKKPFWDESGSSHSNDVFKIGLERILNSVNLSGVLYCNLTLTNDVCFTRVDVNGKTGAVALHCCCGMDTLLVQKQQIIAKIIAHVVRVFVKNTDSLELKYLSFAEKTPSQVVGAALSTLPMVNSNSVAVLTNDVMKVLHLCKQRRMSWTQMKSMYKDLLPLFDREESDLERCASEGGKYFHSSIYFLFFFSYLTNCLFAFFCLFFVVFSSSSYTHFTPHLRYVLFHCVVSPQLHLKCVYSMMVHC